MARQKWKAPRGQHPPFVENYRVIMGGVEQFRLTGGVILNVLRRRESLWWEGKNVPVNPPRKGLVEDAFLYFEKARHEPPAPRKEQKADKPKAPRRKRPVVRQPQEPPPWGRRPVGFPDFVDGYRVLRDGTQEVRFYCWGIDYLVVAASEEGKPARLTWYGSFVPDDFPQEGSIESALQHMSGWEGVPGKEAERDAQRAAALKEEQEAHEAAVRRIAKEEEALRLAWAAFQTDAWPEWLARHEYPSLADQRAREYQHVTLGPPWPETLKHPEMFAWRLIVRPDRIYFLPATHHMKGWSELYVMVPRVHASIGGSYLSDENGRNLTDVYFHDNMFVHVIRKSGWYALEGVRHTDKIAFQVTLDWPYAPIMKYGGPVEWSGLYQRAGAERVFRIGTGHECDEVEVTGIPNLLL